MSNISDNAFLKLCQYQSLPYKCRSMIWEMIEDERHKIPFSNSKGVLNIVSETDNGHRSLLTAVSKLYSLYSELYVM